MRKSIYSLLYILMAIALFASCEHKDLCYKHPHTAKVRVDVDWSKFNSYEKPTGMTVLLYPQYSGERAISHLTNTTTHAIVNLPADRYDILVFNQSTSEFGSVSFRGLDQQETAEVLASEHKSRWYKVRSEQEKVVVEPEWLGVGSFENAEVTQAMIDEEVEHTMNGNATTKSRETVIATVTPKNVIHTLKVKVHIKGIYNLRSARAAINSMAEGYRLISNKPTKSKATYLMEEWRLTRNEADPTTGYIETSITCFGLPDGHQATAEENLLSLSFLLQDNKTMMEFPFQVGNMFTRATDLENELVLYLEIDSKITLPDVEPEGGTSGGFSAEVEDWGDEEEYEIEI